ncbi:helix-turn-helix domain-containing protein [Clostridium sp. Marseille-P299]|uniref:helix-turn-helix domain-containing protein n=1 Tax=Clostridium sp. Marseille-P299 TaxID=1805477 RepID=UPI00082CD953|nr:helix-turn-helix transcriptional regulator [Clostridium sp. Marseille-P299]
MNTEKIGAFIAQCRKLKNMTQQQLADELGITNKAVSKWETGQGMPDVSMLPAIAELLDITVDELLKGEKIIKTEVYGNIASEKSGSFEIAQYLVNKSIIKFKIFSTWSIIFAIVGVIIPYFIWNETKDYTGLLFGLWLEVCSMGAFYVGYIITGNEINSYNKMAKEKINRMSICNNHLKICAMLWSIIPIILFVSIICNILSLSFMFKAILIILAYAFVNIIIFKYLFKSK